MARIIPATKARELAGLELNALLGVQALPSEPFVGGRVAATGTPVYDVNGELLLRRFPIVGRGARASFADVAVNPAIGGPLMAVTTGFEWREGELLHKAADAARRLRPNLRWDATRFVAFSYPRLAVQFLAGSREVLMLELFSWAEVPEQAVGDRQEVPAIPSLHRRSFLDAVPAQQQQANARSVEARMQAWGRATGGTGGPAAPLTLGRWPVTDLILRRVRERELHFSARASDHRPCYELRGQETRVWCVGASVQMVLDFYRYEYTQTRIAQEVGLGTPQNPNGLHYGDEGNVVTALSSFTTQALHATWLKGVVPFATFRDEIDANRPMISFIWGHSRTVAGYRELMLHLVNQPWHWLEVYDPWPPQQGVITWEDFDVAQYYGGYTIHLDLIA